MEKLSIKCPAKVNLFLEIIRKRKDGFHDLESVFQTIPLYDTLELTPYDNLILKVDDPQIPTDQSNLIIKAAKLMQQISGINEGARFTLSKNIPCAGGLGGGSSNAAATLILLNKIWKLNMSKKELAKIGSQIGSDVPFFIYGDICLCEGRGEIVTPLNNASKLPLNIIAPPWGISTPIAFKNLDSKYFNKFNVTNFIYELEKNPQSLAEIYSKSFNHFEEIVFRLEPRQKLLYETLTNNNIMSRMSGSGSSIWAIKTKSTDLIDIIPQSCKVIL